MVRWKFGWCLAALAVFYVQLADAKCIGNVSAPTYNALQDLYVSTSGNNWTWNGVVEVGQVWTFPSPLSAPCAKITWYGLTCDVDVDGLDLTGDCIVTDIDLSEFNLLGTLPPNLCSITSLQTLKLSDNPIYGSLPSELGDCSKMQDLELLGTTLTGTMPTTFGNLLQLETLVLGQGGSLYGHLPTELGLLTNVKEISLQGNYFTGPLPQSFQNLLSIETLAISRNLLSGPLMSNLGQFTQLQEFDAFANFLSGTIPEDVGNCADLTALDLASNMIESDLPFSLGNLIKLIVLDVSYCLIFGTIPSILGNLGMLELLDINNNPGINGTIPEEIGRLQSLVTLDFYGDTLTGTIPSTLGGLQNLFSLSLDSNMLTGSVPVQFGNMIKLQHLYLQENLLTGPIPRELGSLTRLTTLYLRDNYMTGTIPSEIGSLLNLSFVSVGLNSLSGSIPTQLSTMSSARIVMVGLNFLSGSMPSELSVWGKLEQFITFENFLTGTVPPAYRNWTQLETLALYQNLLSGTFPEIFEEMTNISQIVIGLNAFSGPLIDKFGDARKLRSFVVSVNRFTGTVPSVFLEQPLLQDIVLNNNWLTGSVDASLVQYEGVKIVYLDNNFFTSTIPVFVGPIMEALTYSHNYFSGIISSELASNRLLAELSLGFNLLTSSLPLEYGTMISLQTLNISGNMLTGNLLSVFANETRLSQLQLIDGSQNAFTGNIPEQLFAVGSSTLSEVILYSNCFTGTLPSSICESENLQTLVLDALSSADMCRVKFGALDDVIKATISKQSIKGSIPECIWTMSELTTLHLSGNGLAGSLGELVEGLSVLNDISLASNRLVGSLPTSWQQWGRFVELDLNSNKITGSLSSNFSVGSLNHGSTFDLTVNRLSGDIPESLRHASNVNVLEGNLFQCSRQTVPLSDPNEASYTCGASDWNNALSAWFAMFCVGGILVSLNRRWLRKEFSDLCSRFALLLSASSSIVEFIKFLEAANWQSFMLAVLFVFVALPLFILFKMVPQLALYYSTHSFQYTWTASVVYLHGVAPTVLVICALCVSIGLLRGRYFSSSVSEPTSTPKGSSRLLYALVPLTAVVHMVVTVSVNVLYVYTLLKGLPEAQLFFIQLALSIFKVLWNSAFVPFALKRLHLLPQHHSVCSVFMMLFTFIVSPLIATFFSDSACFKYIVVEEPSTSSSFPTNAFACQLVCHYSLTRVYCSETCGYSDDFSIVIDTIVQPGWMYSYQCSSALILNYIPVLMLAYAISGLLAPGIEIAFVYGSHFMQSYLPSWLWRFLSKYVKDSLYSVESEVDNHHADLKAPLMQQPKNVFSASSIVSKAVLNIAVLLTFGLASPLLAVAVALELWVTVNKNRLLFQRFLSRNNGQHTNFPKDSATDDVLLFDQLAEAAVGALDGLNSSMWMVIILTVGFWGFFVFDMMGDVYGPAVGGLCVIPAVICPLLVHACNVLLSSAKQHPRPVTHESMLLEKESSYATPQLSLVDPTFRESQLGIQDEKVWDGSRTASTATVHRYNPSLNDTL